MSLYHWMHIIPKSQDLIQAQKARHILITPCSRIRFTVVTRSKSFARNSRAGTMNPADSP